MDAGPCLAGYEGGFAVADQFRAKAVHVCFATSQCKGPALCPAPWNHDSGCRNLRDAMLGGLNKIDAEGVAHPFRHVYELQCDPDLGCFVKTNGYLDAWGRRYSIATFPPSAQTYQNDWSYSGECDPAVIAPCPSPAPTPRPTPTPVPSASPVAGDGIAVQLDACPDDYPRRPDHVKVGHNSRPSGANPAAKLINLSPIMEHAAYCLDENGKSRGVPCEAWIPCSLQGLHDDKDPQSSWEPAVRAWGPGWPAGGDGVERRSRDAEKWEKPCPSDNAHCYINYYLANLVIGPGGSPPGTYHVCAAPTEAEINGPNAECWDFDLR